MRGNNSENQGEVDRFSSVGNEFLGVVYFKHSLFSHPVGVMKGIRPCYGVKLENK